MKDKAGETPLKGIAHRRICLMACRDYGPSPITFVFIFHGGAHLAGPQLFYNLAFQKLIRPINSTEPPFLWTKRKKPTYSSACVEFIVKKINI